MVTPIFLSTFQLIEIFHNKNIELQKYKPSANAFDIDCKLTKPSVEGNFTYLFYAILSVYTVNNFSIELHAIFSVSDKNISAVEFN